MGAKYNEYISEHIANVKKAYFWLKDRAIIDLKEDEADFLKQLNIHDLSKYGEKEYDAYDKYFYGTKNKEVEKEFNYAWLHHIHANPHHWQYWILKHDDEPEEILEMPIKYAVEMICDWWSFSHKTGNLYEIFDWYEKHKGMVLHEKTRRFVEDTLDKIKQELDKEKKKQYEKK